MLDLPSGRRGLEGQSQAVHAVAKTGGLGAIVEDMAEMAAAAPAVHSRPVHPERSVLRRSDGIVERRPETRPAGTAVEFRRRGEEVEAATGAGESARAMFLKERTGERPFRRALAQHRILIGGQKLLPLIIAVSDFEGFGR